MRLIACICFICLVACVKHPEPYPYAEAHEKAGFRVLVNPGTFSKPVEFFIRDYSSIRTEDGSNIPFDLVLNKYRLISNVFEIVSAEEIAQPLEVEFSNYFNDETTWNYNVYNKVLRTKPYKIPKKNNMFESVLSTEDWIEIEEFDEEVSWGLQVFNFDITDLDYYYCLAWDFEY